MRASALRRKAKEQIRITHEKRKQIPIKPAARYKWHASIPILIALRRMKKSMVKIDVDQSA